MADLQVVIPGVPPSLNRLTVGRGRVFRSDEWDTWKTDAVRLIREAKRLQKWTPQPGRHLWRIKIMWYRPDRRRRDSDNVVKAIGDALSAALDIDDCNFEYTTYRGWAKDSPRVVVLVGLDESQWRVEVFRQYTGGK